MFNETRTYRPDEVAEVLCVSVKTIRRMVNDVLDPLPAIRLKREIRIHGSSLNRYLENHQIHPEE